MNAAIDSGDPRIGDTMTPAMLRPLWVEYDAADARARLPAHAAVTINNNERYWILDEASSGLIAFVDSTRGIFWSLYIGEAFLDLCWTGSVDIAMAGAETAFLQHLSAHQKVAILHLLAR
jgi:hypothetical protein